MNTKMSAGDLLLSESAQAIKPIADIAHLIENIEPFCEPFKAKKGEILRYGIRGKRTCYLLHEGSVTLNRRGDGMVMNSEKSVFILGVSNQLSQTENLYIRVTENARMSRLSLERFNLVIESCNVWQSLCKLLVYTASRIYDHSSAISQMSSYEIIRFQLQELMRESEQTRCSITAANYILSRTYLSRSGVMRIIATLRDAGCITLERGVLVRIDSLPLKY